MTDWLLIELWMPREMVLLVVFPTKQHSQLSFHGDADHKISFEYQYAFEFHYPPADSADLRIPIRPK